MTTRLNQLDSVLVYLIQVKSTLRKVDARICRLSNLRSAFIPPTSLSLPNLLTFQTARISGVATLVFSAL